MKDNIRRLYAEFETEHYHIAGTPFHPLNDPPFEARDILESLSLFRSLATLFDDALEVMTLARNRLDLDSDSWRYGIEVIRQHKGALGHIDKGDPTPTAVKRTAFPHLWPTIDRAPDADLLALFALGGGWWAVKYLSVWAQRQEERLLAEADEVPAMLRHRRSPTMQANTPSLFAVKKRSPILPQLMEGLKRLRVIETGQFGASGVPLYLDMDAASLERYIDTLETALVPLSTLPDLASSWMLCALESELPPDAETVRNAADLMRELGAVSGWLRDSLELAKEERQQRANNTQHPHYQPTTCGQ